MSKGRAVHAERRALLVVIALLLGVISGFAVAVLLFTAGAHPAYGIVTGGAAFATVVGCVIKVFTAMRWL